MQDYLHSSAKESNPIGGAFIEQEDFNNQGLHYHFNLYYLCSIKHERKDS
jgi:hypothetical protein